MITDTNGVQLPAIEQFCTQFCNADADCGSGYACVMPSNSPMKMCKPADDSCWQ
jgi:hypothetical protein